MRNLTLIFSVVFGLNLVAAFFSLWNANIDQQRFDSTAVKQIEDESIEIRLARAHLKLAQHDLHRFQEANKRIPNTFASEFVDNLRLHVVSDEAELAQRLKGKDADAHQVCIRRAKFAVEIATASLESRRATYQRMSTSTNAERVERAEIVAEIAKLNLEKIRSLDISESVLTHLQWQIDELRHQVLELRMKDEQ